MSATVSRFAENAVDPPPKSLDLCVLNVAFPFAPVSGDAAGGAEQVVFHLDQGITASGGESIVIASEGSSVSGTLVPVSCPHSVITPQEQQRIWRECRAQIERTLRRHRIDLVHFHGIDFFQYLPCSAVPKLATLHLPPAWYPAEVFDSAKPLALLLNCVSHSQHRSCPASEALLPWIENGVPIPRVLPRNPKTEYVVSLGRICPEKGFHLAIDAARLAGKKMILAGALFGYEVHHHYFKSQIAPRLDAQRRFIGPVGRKEKGRLLAQARCLVVPSQVPETSSLVAMEALACGTPVVAFRQGALTEIVEHGVTGFLVDNVSEMAEAIDAVSSLSPERCWKTAQNRFPVERMVAQYLERYRWLVGHAKKFAECHSNLL